MKKLSLLISIILLSLISEAQTVTIPDANFAAYLQTIVPLAMTGNQLNTNNPTVLGIDSINVANKAISNLFGVQYFTSLTYLNCSTNNLTSLSVLPNSLDTLICFTNQLSNLPMLPNSITFLDCGGNQLTGFTNLPSSLRDIECSSNNITSFPTFPPTLQILDCDINQLTSLPTLPNNLKILQCDHNNINCLPTLPNTITYLVINNNSFTCVPNYITAMDAAAQAYPLCTAGNANGCAVTGIEQIRNATDVKIYPNPSHGNITLSTLNNIDKIIVNDILGKIIYEAKPDSNKTTLEIDTSGVYFITIISGGNSSTNKIIIN